MGFYLKSNESVDENHVVTSAEAPIQGLPEGMANCLKSATVVALLEDYLRVGMKHHAFESGDEMVAKAKEIVSSALDNGDLSSSEAEHVIAWAEQHRMDGPGCEKAMEKFIKHVCAEEVSEVCGDSGDVPEDIKRAAEIKKQCEQMGADMAAKYGPIIKGYACDFIRLYGKLMDPKFVEKFACVSE